LPNPSIEDDLRYRRSQTVLRWSVATIYVVVVVFLVDTNDVLKWTTSAAVVGAAALHTWLRLIKNNSDSSMVVHMGMLDVLLVTGAIITIADTNAPTWAVYLGTLVGMTGTLSTKQMIRQSSWASVNCFAAAVIIARMGGNVSWLYVSIQSLLIVLLAYQAQLMADGNRRLHTDLSHLAEIDELTGIANRGLLVREFGVALALATENGTPLAVAIIDLDHFKSINDEYGHAAGDSVLQSVARTLEAARTPDGLVARFGGDEFACLAPGLSRQGAEAWCERVRGEAAKQEIGLTIGVAMFPADGADVSTLLASADAALYRGKRAGRGRVTGSAAA
jgi:diguanylate cyclase (GGDEF)-like protein